MPSVVPAARRRPLGEKRNADTPRADAATPPLTLFEAGLRSNACSQAVEAHRIQYVEARTATEIRSYLANSEDLATCVKATQQHAEAAACRQFARGLGRQWPINARSRRRRRSRIAERSMRGKGVRMAARVRA